jgi:hypothetical protein
MSKTSMSKKRKSFTVAEAKEFVDQVNKSYSSVTVQDYCSRNGISVSSFKKEGDACMEK